MPEVENLSSVAPPLRAVSGSVNARLQDVASSDHGFGGSSLSGTGDPRDMPDGRSCIRRRNSNHRGRILWALAGMKNLHQTRVVNRTRCTPEFVPPPELQDSMIADESYRSKLGLDFFGLESTRLPLTFWVATGSPGNKYADNRTCVVAECAKAR